MKILKIVSGLLWLISLVACTRNTQPVLELHQMTNPHTASQMNKMAVSLRHILDLYVAQQDDQVIDAGTVVLELDKLSVYAQSTQGKLASQSEATTRDGLDDSSLTPYMTTYLKEVAKARALASDAQPDIKPAAELINSCLACHKEL